MKIIFTFFMMLSLLGANAQQDPGDIFGARSTGSGEPQPLVEPQSDPGLIQSLSGVLLIDEGFEDITSLPGWFMQNNSSPVGSTGWFQGNTSVFSAFDGATNAYIAANFNNGGGISTISNWLLTPEVDLKNGDVFSFWTRCPAGSIWPDRLELRLSLNANATNVGLLPTDVGDFTTLLLSVNPTLAQGGYPDTWAQYQVVLSGIPANSTGRFALRYYVSNGGSSGTNSDYIGIDRVQFYAETVAVPLRAWAVFAGLSLMALFVLLRARKLV
ncbi:MAG: choice-of-anchor J domain-containing protein [Bacteroidales bacterium]